MVWIGRPAGEVRLSTSGTRACRPSDASARPNSACDAELDRGAGLGGIVDRVGASRRGWSKSGGSDAVDRRCIASQPSAIAQRIGQRAGRDRHRGGACRRAAAAASRRERASSVASSSVDPGDRRRGVRSACGAVGPGQQREAVGADAVEQRGGDRRPGRRPSRDRRRGGSRRGGARAAPATPPVAGSKRDACARVSIRSANSASTVGWVDRARRRGCARPTPCPASRRPRAIRRGRAGSVGSSLKPRPPTEAQVSPDASRRRAMRSGKASARQVATSAPPPACGRGLGVGCRPIRESGRSRSVRGRPTPSPSLQAGGERAWPTAPPASVPPPPAGPRSRPPAPQPQLEIGVVAAQPALAEQHRDLRGGRAPARVSPARTSMCAEARRQRQARRSRGRARSGGRPASSASSAVSRVRASATAASGGGSSQRERARIGDAPERAVEHQRRQVGLEDLGRVEARQAGGRRFLPQAIGDARPLPRGAAGALGDRGLARALGDEPRHPRRAIVARAAGEARIDHDADAVERQAGLGDRGREHELARARPARARSRRAGRRDRGCRGAGGARRRAGRPSRSAVRSISATPGRKASTPPSLLAQRRADRARRPRPRSAPRLRGRDGAASSGWLRPSLSITGASPISAAKRAPSSVADIATSRRSGRNAACASSASARPKSLSRLRSWTSSNSTADTPASSGSAWMRCDEDALGDHRHARRGRALAVHARGIAEGLADRFAGQRRHPLGGGARGEAAGGEQQDLAGAPGLAEQRRARPRWSCPRPAARRARHWRRRAARRAGRAGRRGWEGCRSPLLVVTPGLSRGPAALSFRRRSGTPGQARGDVKGYRPNSIYRWRW